jgi:hypothetical protein
VLTSAKLPKLNIINICGACYVLCSACLNYIEFCGGLCDVV